MLTLRDFLAWRSGVSRTMLARDWMEGILVSGRGFLTCGSCRGRRERERERERVASILLMQHMQYPNVTIMLIRAVPTRSTSYSCAHLCATKWFVCVYVCMCVAHSESDVHTLCVKVFAVSLSLSAPSFGHQATCHGCSSPQPFRH